MGGLRASEWVITLVFFLYSNYARHFTRLRHTLKGVVLCCFSLLCVADIGWKFCRMLHCCGLFFSSGQFKSCFPHFRSPCKSRAPSFFIPQIPLPYPYRTLTSFLAIKSSSHFQLHFCRCCFPSCYQ